MNFFSIDKNVHMYVHMGSLKLPLFIYLFFLPWAAMLPFVYVSFWAMLFFYFYFYFLIFIFLIFQAQACPFFFFFFVLINVAFLSFFFLFFYKKLVMIFFGHDFYFLINFSDYSFYLFMVICHFFVLIEHHSLIRIYE